MQADKPIKRMGHRSQRVQPDLTADPRADE